MRLSLTTVNISFPRRLPAQRYAGREIVHQTLERRIRNSETTHNGHKAVNMGQALSATIQPKWLLPNLSGDESSSLPGLLRLPAEIKLQIMYDLVRADP